MTRTSWDWFGPPPKQGFPLGRPICVETATLGAALPYRSGLGLAAAAGTVGFGLAAAVSGRNPRGPPGAVEEIRFQQLCCRGSLVGGKSKFLLQRGGPANLNCADLNIRRADSERLRMISESPLGLEPRARRPGCVTRRNVREHTLESRWRPGPAHANMTVIYRMMNTGGSLSAREKSAQPRVSESALQSRTHPYVTTWQLEG